MIARMFARTIRTMLLMLAATILVAACGGSSSSSNDTKSNAGGAGSLTHVDGTITLAGDGFTLQPKAGGAATTFTLGPEVEQGALRAIAASGQAARVSYRAGDDPLIAASVRPAPKIGEGMQSYVGTIVKVDASTLVVDGDDGERTFDISGADADVFDVPHLEEHEAQSSPIRVYYDPKAPDVGVAYEDA